MKAISIIWIAFTAIFILLSIVSFVQAGKRISAFNLSQRPLAAIVTVKIAGADVDQPLKDFAADMNKYIGSYNSSSRCQNLIAGWGYIAAAIVSAASFMLEQKWI